MQVRDGSLLEMLRAALHTHAMPPGSVEIELTETTLMDSVDKTLVQLHAIKRLGVELAIDDFGTGYSSLNDLNRFPIDRLKIDRSFVRDMLDDPTDLAITGAIIGRPHARPEGGRRGRRDRARGRDAARLELRRVAGLPDRAADPGPGSRRLARRGDRPGRRLKPCGPRPQAASTGIFAIRARHFFGPVSCTETPVESTATVTGMSRTSNS